jgi:(p)ppGpp synthase/HD superfamily hydrolase
MTGVLVNGIEVPFRTELKNNDIVQIITNSKLYEKSIEGDDAYTITAKEKILNRQN